MVVNYVQKKQHLIDKYMTQQEKDFKEFMDELDTKEKILGFGISPLTIIQYNLVAKSKINQRLENRFSKMTAMETLNLLSINKNQLK